MNRKQIKVLQAQINILERKASSLARSVGIFPNEHFYFEEIHEEGVILSYFFCGAQDNIIVPWIAFDEGVEAWKAKIEEDKRIIEEKFRVLEEEDQRQQKERRYQQYLKLKEEFEHG